VYRRCVGHRQSAADVEALVKAVVQRFGSGSIVNISSVNGLTAAPHGVGYSIAKHGILGSRARRRSSTRIAASA
jgi:NAD(P)-dependent dehydrogenase (short-subunit alcohol dehydrogenase family)